MNRRPQRDGKSHLCCAFFGPQGHEGSLNMSVDFQSRSRGSLLRVVSYFQRLMDGRRATGIAMDYCKVVSHSFHMALDKVRVGSKSNDDAQYTWESVAGGSFIVRKDTEMVYGAAPGGGTDPSQWSCVDCSPPGCSYHVALFSRGTSHGGFHGEHARDHACIAATLLA